MPRTSWLIASLILSASLSAQQPTSGSAEVHGDRIVARINQEIILEGEVYDRIAPELKSLQQSSPDEATRSRKAAELWRKTLRDMAEDKVLLQAAAAEGIRVEARDVDRELEKQIKAAGGVDRLKATLASLGLTLEEHRERTRVAMIERELILTKLGVRQTQVTPSSPMPRDIFVTPKEMAEYYAEDPRRFYVPERVRSRVIIFPFTSATRDTRRAEAESVLRQVRHGADMSLLALWYDAERPADGGLRDWSERRAFPSEVAEVLFTLPKGDLGPVVETERAFVVLRCEDRMDARQRRLADDDVQDEIRSTLWQQKIDAQVRAVKKALRDAACIEPVDLFEER